MPPLPAQMPAVTITRPGGPDVLMLETSPVPTPGAGQILIEVAAAGINRPDVLQRLGAYPPPPGASDLPGLEVSGRVAATGPGADRYQLGDQVCALVSGGGYAGYCLADEPLALPVPKGFSLTEAAGLPETFFTVWSNLFMRAGLKSGETVLIHGGASGIGTTATQLAKQRGATVIATAGSAKKCAACTGLGADLAINYLEDDFVSAVKEFTSRHGADVILDMVGGDYVERNFRAAARDGRIAMIGFMGGTSAETDFMPLLLKRLTLTGSTLRARPLADKAAIAAGLEREVWPLLASGAVRPVIDSTFSLEHASAAHERMEAGEHIGKIILENPAASRI